MSKIKNDEPFIRSILKYIAQTEEIIESNDLTYEKFENSLTYRSALAMAVFQVTEYSSKLSTEFKNTYTKVPWNQIYGMRNRVAHGYDGLDFEYIWVTATEHIPIMRDYLEQICREEFYDEI